MRTLLALLTCLLAAMLLAVPGIAAQDDIDITAIAETVLTRDAESLVRALQTPMVAEELPAAFSDAEYVEPESIPGNTDDLVGDEMGDIIGTVMYSVAYEPGGGAPSPVPSASPQAGGPVRIYSTASLNYVVYADEINPEMLESLGEAVLATLGDPAADMEVDEIVIDETTAYVITITTVTNGVELVMQWFAIPVGNVAVISMAMSGGIAVDVEVLREDARALALAGAQHLGAVAEDESQPAG